MTPQKTTDQLRTGDIVVHHGMRIRLDTEPRTGIYDGMAVYAWPGLVLNADELCDKDSPDYDPYIARHIRGVWWEDRVPRPRKDEWTVQGNKLACWYVEDAHV